MMTNEQLATLSKSGHSEFLSPLWENTHRLIEQMIWNEFSRLQGAGVDLEDLKQNSFFVVLLAVRYFEPEKGLKFTSYLRFCTLSVCRAAVREAMGWNRHTTSLFKPIGEEEEECSLSDVIPDPAAELEFLTAEERVYNEGLHNALSRCMASGLSEIERDVVERWYYQRQKPDEIETALELKPKRAGWIRERALRKMRHPKNRRFIEQYREDVIDTRAYYGGVDGFNRTWTSSTERAALALIDLSPRETGETKTERVQHHTAPSEHEKSPK